MRKILTFLAVAGFAAAFGGCGGSSGPSDALLTFHPGAKWVYAISNGSLTVPSSGGSSGGTTQGLQSKSTLTMTVEAATSKDANGATVNILDRNFDLFTLDGREIKGNFRLYFTQTNLGMFVHGVNNYLGTTANPANDQFVPSTATPAFQFLYLPNPASDGTTLSYSNPLGLTVTGNPPPDVSYSLQLGTGRSVVNVPAGGFSVKAAIITENFNRSIAFGTPASGTQKANPAAFSPNSGIIEAPFTATLPDGSQISGLLVLTQLSL